jgi:hypothetical protein
VSADVLLLTSDTEVPDGPAGPVNNTVPVPEAPPVTLAGSAMELSVAGMTVPVAIWVSLPSIAATLTGVDTSTA